jgi:hypothetical protein
MLSLIFNHTKKTNRQWVKRTDARIPTNARIRIVRQKHGPRRREPSGLA